MARYRLTIACVAFAALASFWYLLPFNASFLLAPQSIVDLVAELHFCILLPAMWYGLWAILLAGVVSVASHSMKAYAGVVGLLALQIAVNASSSVVPTMFARPTFNEFVATDLFGMIKKQLVLAPNERVGCVAFHPAAARYNGIKTLGSANLPDSLADKELVRQAIVRVLERNPRVKKYFERPNAPVYLYDDELSTTMTDQRKINKRLTAITPDYDLSVLKRAGVRYLVSALPFRAPNDHGFQLVYRGKTSYYQMFVYRIV